MYKSPHDSAPPSLPPRPGGRARPVPAAPVEEIYDDCDDANSIPPQPDDEYDDFEAGGPPPLPPHPEACYDDIGQLSPPPPPPPQRPKPGLPLMSAPAPQEDYDDCGPIVQQLPKRPQRNPPAPTPPTNAGRPPSPPQESVYELGDDGVDDDDSGQSHPPLLPPPSLEDEMRAIYEVEPDIDPEPARSAAPPAPILPPKTPSHPPPPTPDHAPPHPSRPSHQAAMPVTSSKGAAPPGSFSMNLGLLQNARAGLRKVSDGSGTLEASPHDASHDPKIYGACPDTVYDAKKVFEQKSGGKPGSFKQNIFDKAKPPLPSTPAAPKPQQAVKPIPKVEPKYPQPEDPEEIYDDAASSVPDPMMRYDWYHGIISRSDGDQHVRTVAKDGAFLVRVSEKDPKFPFTLVVFHMGSVSNLRIRSRTDGQVALGDEKTGELAFKDVPAMIHHHRNHSVVLLGNNQKQVKLQHVVPRS